MQQSLGGHALPLDDPTVRTLRLLGLVDEHSADPEALRASLEHLIPKSRGPLFIEIMSALAHDSGWERDPSCPLRGFTHDAREENGTHAAAERVGRQKPR